MRIERLLFALLLMALLWQITLPQDDGHVRITQPNQSADDKGKDLALIRDLADLLPAKDEQVRRVAQDELLKYGPKALPVLEQRIRDKQAGSFYDMIRQIETKYVPEIPRADFSKEPELQWFAALGSQIKPPKREEMDQYLMLKLYEAYARITRKDFDGAEAVLRAIRSFDTGWRFSDKTADLHNYVQMKILEGKLLKPRALAAKAVIKVGDAIELSIRLHNISTAKITITPTELGDPLLRSQIFSRATDWTGAEWEEQDEQQVFPFPKKIEIEPGQEWESSVRYTPKALFPEKDDIYREHTLNLFTTHVNLETAEGKLGRKLVFPSVRVKVLPGKYIAYGESPLKSWEELLSGKGVDDGTINELFLCALLLRDDPEQVRRGVALFLPYVEKATNPSGISACVKLLERMTGVRQNDKDAWLRWCREFIKPKENPK